MEKKTKGYVLGRVVRDSHAEKVTFKLKPKRWGETCHEQ